MFFPVNARNEAEEAGGGRGRGGGMGEENDYELKCDKQ